MLVVDILSDHARVWLSVWIVWIVVLAVVERYRSAEIILHNRCYVEHLVNKVVMIDKSLLDASLVADDVDGSRCIGADGLNDLGTPIPVVAVFGEGLAGLGLDERAVEVAEE